MGRRGPPPKPTRLRIMHGSNLPKNPHEPNPKKITTMRCPGWLPDGAKKVWRQVVPLLIANKLLTVLDTGCLERYCVAQAKWQKLEIWLRDNNDFYAIRNDQGQIKYMAPVPQVSMARHAAKAANLFGAELGLSPAARTRIHLDHVADQTEQQKASKFFGAG